MNANPFPHIVRVTSLKAFLAEVPAAGESAAHKSVVRLLNHQVEGQHSAALLLSLQGLNPEGHVVWLCEAHTVSWLYGKPFGPAAEWVYGAMRDLEKIVREYLTSRGYDVREGDYGLPDDIKPLAASFECARWVRVGEQEWKPRPAESDEDAHETF